MPTRASAGQETHAQAHASGGPVKTPFRGLSLEPRLEPGAPDPGPTGTIC